MTEMTRAEKERREQARKRYKAGGTWEDKKPKPKAAKKENKSRKERTAEIDADKLIPMLGTLFMSKDPLSSTLAARHLPELSGISPVKEAGSFMDFARGRLPEHALTQVGTTAKITPTQALLHEIVHVLQNVVRPGEEIKQILDPKLRTPVQVLEQELGAWAPQVRKDVPGGIKTIQDISRSRSLPSYYEGYSTPYGQGGIAAKKALMQARRLGEVKSSIPAVTRASKSQITPDVIKMLQDFLKGKALVKETGPANLQALAPLGATQALRALLNLPLKGILPMLSPEKMDEIFRKVMPFSGVRG